MVNCASARDKSAALSHLQPVKAKAASTASARIQVYMADSWGALLQPLLFVSGVLFVAGAAIQAGAVNVAMLVVGRVVLGLGVGIASLVQSHSVADQFRLAPCSQYDYISATLRLH